MADTTDFFKSRPGEFQDLASSIGQRLFPEKPGPAAPSPAATTTPVDTDTADFAATLGRKLFPPEPPQPPEPKKKINENKGTTLGAFAKTLAATPENIISSIIQGIQGQSGASVTDQDIADRLVNWVEERNKARSQEYANTGDFIPGLISKQDVAELAQNLGFSISSMGASAGAGAAAGSVVPGAGTIAGTVAGVLGGMAGGGTSAYRMQAYQTMNEWLKKKNEESIQKYGRGISPEEETAFKNEFSSLATENGLWEAGPEAIGNVLELAFAFGEGTVPGRIAKLIPKGMAGKAIKAAGRVAGVLGTEAATETVTQMGQHNVDVKAGQTTEPMRQWTSGDDWLKSAREVLPQVILLSGLMSASGSTYRKLAGHDAGANNLSPAQQKDNHSPAQPAPKAATPSADMPMTTNPVDSKTVVTEDQRQDKIEKNLFDAVASEDLSKQTELEQARVEENARRDAETARIAALEQAQRDQAVVDAQSQTSSAITQLAGNDSRKQAIAGDVFGMSDRVLISALRKELNLDVSPSAAGEYAIATQEGPLPATLLDMRQRLIEKRISDLDAKDTKEAADAEAVRKMEQEQAKKKAEKKAADSLRFARDALSKYPAFSAPSPEQITLLQASRDNLSDREREKLDGIGKETRQPSKAVSLITGLPPKKKQIAIISEEVNPDKTEPSSQNNEQSDAPLVSLMLSDLGSAGPGGQLMTDAEGNTTRTNTGISWLSSANEKLAKSDRVDISGAQAVLNNAQSGKAFTDRQQRQYDAMMNAHRSQGGEKIGQALAWAEKGFIPVDNQTIPVRDMVEGDQYVIDNEEFKVTDIDDEGNVTLKDGTIKKVRDGEDLHGVDFVKPAEGATDFNITEEPTAKTGTIEPPASVTATTGIKKTRKETKTNGQMQTEIAPPSTGESAGTSVGANNHSPLQTNREPQPPASVTETTGLKSRGEKFFAPTLKNVEKAADLSQKSVKDLVGDMFDIINEHLGERGSISTKEIDQTLYDKLKPYLAEISKRAKQKALDARAYLFGAVDSMPEGKAKEVYEAAARRYSDEQDNEHYDRLAAKDEAQAIDNQKSSNYNNMEGENKNVTSNPTTTNQTTPENDRTGIEGPGSPNIQGTESVGPARNVSTGSGRTNDGQLRNDELPTHDVDTTSHTEGLHEARPGDLFRTQPGVGTNNGDVAGIQRSAENGRIDHVITPGSIDRSGSWHSTATTNIDIIELVKKIQAENRAATPEEQALLARYTGFGATEIANKMFPGLTESREIQLWRADPKWRPLVERMMKVLTPEEIATAARSTQYAHYTSPEIIQSIYKAIHDFGFPGGRILEPGMGVGSFFGMMPESMRNASIYTGIEMDGITAQIAKLLYPNQNIIEGDYAKTQFPNNYFDMSVGNPPFGKIKIMSDADYRKLRLSLHDFFFVKTLDKIRPGGLMVFITSRYMMDKVDSRIRKLLNEKSDLIGAIRLPQTAFKKNAGTEVVTDIIFLRKKVPGEQTSGMLWNEVGKVNTPEGEFQINEYYVAHPEMVLGEHSGKGKMQATREPQYTVLPHDGRIEDEFTRAAEKLPREIYSMTKAAPQQQEAAAIEKDFNPLNKKEGGLYLSSKGEVMSTESGAGVPLSTIAKKLFPKDHQWLKSYVSLRDAVKQCQYDQLTDGDWEKSLKQLQKTYTHFKMTYGRIREYTTIERKDQDEDGNEIIVPFRKHKNERLYKLDVEHPLVLALEHLTEDGRIEDGPFLKDRTIKKPEPPQIHTAADALAVSLNEKGKLDIDHIASLLGQNASDIFEQLGDLVYDTPDQGIQLADEYLSGNVVQKLEEAKAAAAINPKYERNVKALIDAQPQPLTTKDITAMPGATWIPANVYNDFIHEVLEMPGHTEVHHSTSDNQWTISGVSRQQLRGHASEWCTPDRGANEIFNDVLNNATIKVYKTEIINGDKKTFIDPAATAEVNNVAKRMKNRFSNWIWENAQRTHNILDIYNSTRNNIVPRRFSGEHLTMPGVSMRFNLMPHQKNAIWRIIQDGNTYVAHSVGAGKTYEMVAAGMEMKRLGLIHKPIYAVPNHMLQQFANEFQDLYPMAHVMVADEENFHTGNRRRFMAQAALNNPDAIVITHSALGLLKMKEENIAPVRDAVIDDMRNALDDLQDDKQGNRLRIKQMEARIEQTQQRFDAMIAKGDNVLTFEDMGADFLFVDEAHQFRKLDFTTNRQAKGVDPKGSVRAMMLYIKTQWLDKQNPGRSHCFASGTPITNTMGELFTIMKFFDQQQMVRDGIDFFDSWAAEYGDMATVPEMNAAGRYEMVDRFARFINVPELMSRIRSFMDVLTSSQLGAFVKRPKIHGGQPAIIVTPASVSLKDYQTNTLLSRIETSKNWKPSPGQPGNPDPLINIITDGRLASIDMRFVIPGASNDPNSKLNQYINKIIEIHKNTKDNTYLDPATGKQSPNKGGAQICFYNHGFGRGVAVNRGFDARAWAMSRFKEAGIPASEIAWIDDYDTATKKEAMMKEVRNGQKRILFGSAKKMGTGMNVQTRLTDMTYLDPPWYPSDVEQPLGRILRQGNQNPEVGVYYFSTKGSYDATMWQMVTRKAKFIEDALAGGGARSMEDISESSLYEMAAALASGDERAIKLAGLNSDIENLRNLRAAHFSSQNNLEHEKRMYEIGLPGKKSWVEKLTQASEKIPDSLKYAYGNQYPIEAKIGSQSYTDRKAFGQDLLRKIVALKNAGKEGTTVIGDFYGMEIRVVQIQGGGTETHHGNGQVEIIPGELVNQLQLRVNDDINYEVSTNISDTSDPAGLVTRLTNRAKSISSELAKAKDSLKSSETELKKINERLGAPFEMERDLEEKIAEAARINTELTNEGQSNAPGHNHTQPVTPPAAGPTDNNGPMLSLENTNRLGDVELDDMVRQLSALMKGVEIVKRGDEIWIKTKSGDEVKIESAEQIDPDIISLAINKHYSRINQSPKMNVAGMYSSNKITLVKDVAGIWTLSHEFYHFLEDIGAISNADKDVLNRKIASLIKSKPNTFGYLHGRSLPEQRADYVGRTLVGMYDANTTTGKILSRIREIIDRIVNAIGVRTARGVIRDLETGKVYDNQGSGFKVQGSQENVQKTNPSPSPFNKGEGTEEEPHLSLAEDINEKMMNAAGEKVSRAVDLIIGQMSPKKRATFSTLRKNWNEFWKPFSTVKNGDQVLARRYESMGNVAKAARFIDAMKTELDKFPDETKKDIFWFLNGDIPIEALPEDAQEMAKNIQRRTEIIGEMLVDRGLISQETFDKHRGQYVHYLYAKHIVGEDAPVGITSNGKLDLSYTMARNPNLTMQQRKELGLIDDASVAVPVGMGKALTDIAKYDYLETIADNPEWVWTPSVVNVAVGKKLATPINGRTRRFIRMGVGKLQEELRTYDEMMRVRPTPEVAEIHKILSEAWNKTQRQTQNVPADFVQLPNTRGYGPLAGAFVRKPIADDLRPVMDVSTDRGKLLNTILEIERQGMATFKMGKVALNLPTACRNIISNIIQMNMRGRALAKIPGDIINACESMKAKDKYYEEAFSMGLFNTNWFVTEINDVLQEFRKAESGRIDQVLHAVKNVAKYYGKIDDISKFAIFLQMRKAGASMDKATLEAMKWGMDYSLSSRSIKGLRQTIVPFITYQYKIAPLLAESLTKRPWVLAKYAAIYPLAKMLAMSLHDLDDDDWDDLEKQLPAYIKKSASMMILPWKTDNGQWQWVNTEYFFPFGNMLALFRDVRDVNSGELLRDLGISNPFLSMFFTGMSARNDSPPMNSYSGLPVYNELDPGWMKAAKYLEYMANTWMPGMLTRQGAAGYTGRWLMGGEDRWGREVTMSQALGRWFGLNIVSVSPEQSRAQTSVRIQDLHKEMARINADTSRSDEEEAAYQQQMNAEISDLAEQAPAAILPILKAKGHDVVYDALKDMAAKGILKTGPPSQTMEINGVPLKMSMEQYRDYLDRASVIARRKLESMVTSPDWETMPEKRKTDAVSGIVSNARKLARQKIKAEMLRDNRDKILQEKM